MKKILLLLVTFTIIAFQTQAQFDCSNGRYLQKIFPVKTTLDVKYGQNIDYTGASTDVFVDIYEPQGDTHLKRPLIILAHGGSFVGGSKDWIDVTTLCQEFAKRGYVAVSMSYRIGISFFSFDPWNLRFGKAVWRGMQDGKAAVRFFRKDAATTNTYRIDPDHIYMGGVSAGGVIGLTVGYINNPATEIPSLIDTTQMGGIEGNTGNPGYSSEIQGIINLCGALPLNVGFMSDNTTPVVSVHGTADGTVPYKCDYFLLPGLGTQVEILCGSFAIDSMAQTLNIRSDFRTLPGADHVPWLDAAGTGIGNQGYLDTCENMMEKFLYSYVCGATSVENQAPVQNLRVFPNPAKTHLTFNFELQNPEPIRITLSDMMGRKVGEVIDNQQVPVRTIHFERTKNMQSGIYFYQIQGTGFTESGKIVFE